MNLPQITWIYPARFIFFLLLIPLVLLLVYQGFKLQRALKILSYNAAPAGATTARVRFLLKSIFIVIGTAFLLLSLARPAWGKKEEKKVLFGRDVVVALDISRSMLCQDVSPSRLEAAKSKIQYMLRKLPSERKSLLLFAGSPFVICPLTHDHDSFMMFLNQVDAATISSAGTSLDKALRQAIDMLKKMEKRKTKIIVVFTDGEDFSDSLKATEREIAAYGLQVFIVCMGTKEGGPIPLYDSKGVLTGHQKNKDGAVVITKSHYDKMKHLVAASSGACIENSSDMSDMDQLVTLIDAYEKEQLDEQKREALEEKYHYSAAISFIVLALAFLL